MGNDVRIDLSAIFGMPWLVVDDGVVNRRLMVG